MGTIQLVLLVVTAFVSGLAIGIQISLWAVRKALDDD